VIPAFDASGKAAVRAATNQRHFWTAVASGARHRFGFPRSGSCRHGLGALTVFRFAGEESAVALRLSAQSKTGG